MRTFTTSTAALCESLKPHSDGLPDFWGTTFSTFLVAMALISSGVTSSQALGASAAWTGRARNAGMARARIRDMALSANGGNRRSAPLSQEQERQRHHHEQEHQPAHPVPGARVVQDG